MKKFLSTIIILLLSTIVSAQNNIAKNSSIPEKESETTLIYSKYKNCRNFGNHTLAELTNELQTTNFQTLKDYSDKQEDNYIQPILMSSYQQQNYSDAELLKMYKSLMKKGKIYKKVGLIGGCILVVSGIVVAFASPSTDGLEISETEAPYAASLIAAGLIGGTTFYLIGRSMQKRAFTQSFSTSIIQKEFKLDKNIALIADVNVMNDKQIRSKTLGVGLHLNF